MNDLERIKTGTCPFTGKPYDCGRCEEYEKLESMHGPGTLHFGYCFTGQLADGRRGMRALHRDIGGEKACSLDECADFFWELHSRGAEMLPIGDACDRFCYRRGCMGHAASEEKKGGEK